jgi:type 1 glutamine amidotransferase
MNGCGAEYHRQAGNGKQFGSDLGHADSPWCSAQILNILNLQQGT